jgi:hypothetical protein
MIRLAVAMVCFLVFTTVARAQPAQPSPESSDPDNALAQSLGGTATSLALVGASVALAVQPNADENKPLWMTMAVLGAGGIVVAPSLGHVYGAHRWNTTGFQLRLAGVGIAGGGLSLLMIAGLGGGDGWGIAAEVLFGAGAALVLAGGVHDIATVKSATRRYDAIRRAGLSLAPTLIRTANHTKAPGLAITARF